MSQRFLSTLQSFRRRLSRQPRRRVTQRALHAQPAEVLETRELLAAQIVAPSASELTAGPSGQIPFNVDYRTENPEQAPADGLLLRMHYDSSKVTFNDATNILQHGFEVIQDQPDTADADNNAATDRLVRALWFDVDGQWPAQTSAAPLFTANFTAAADFDGSTEVGFTGDPSDGHTFQSESLTIRRALPSTPTLTAPAGSNVPSMPSFTWTAAEGAENYELWVNNLTTGEGRVIHERQLTTNTFTATSSLSDGRYKVWVRGGNSAGYGPWSAAGTFIVGADKPAASQVTGPAQTDTLRPTFTWDTSANASRYEVWANNISTGQVRAVHETTVAGTTFTPTADLAKGIYHVWVRAINNAGASAWSGRFVSVVGDLNEAPTLIGPTQPTFDRTPTFAWNPVAGASGYQLYIRTSAGNTVVNDLTTASYTPDQDLPAGPISWWVRTTDATGNNGWSARGETNIEGRTQVLTPTGSVSTGTPEITWLAVDGASSYIVYVDEQGTSNVVIRETTNSATLTPATPLPAGNYRVWVKAVSSTTNGGFWSSMVEFSVA